MKRFFTVMIALVAMFALNGTAKACSNEQISATNSIVRITLDPHSSRATMFIVAKDVNEEVLCGLDSLWTTTSRNMPNSGWGERVDHIRIFRQGGIAIVTFNTSRPAGTTVYAEANGIKMGNPDGMPFMYEGGHFCNE